MGTAPGDGFATAVAALGDVDGDGTRDYAYSITRGAAPCLRVHSGATGALVRTILPPVGAELFGTVLAAGDVDGDLVSDLLATSRGSAVLAPAVWVFSGASGALLRSHAGASPQDIDFGCALAVLGDTDGDGTGDYAIGNSRRGTSRDGEVHVISGASGALRYSLSRPLSAWNSFGTAIAPMADVDLDGRPELIIGAPDEAHRPYCTGMAFVHSGIDGRLLARAASDNQGWDFGQSVLGADDFDGDGSPDFLVYVPRMFIGGGPRNYHRLLAHSGRTGALIQWVVGLDPWLELGGFGPVVDAGDLNSDGKRDWLLAAPGLNWISLAKAILRDAPVQQPSWSWPTPCHNERRNSLGCTPQITWGGAASMSVGPEPQVTSTKLVPSSVGLLLWSPARASAQIAAGSLCVGAPIRRTPRASTGGTAGSCNGSISHTFTRAQLASLGLVPGSELVVQSWNRDPGYAPPGDFNVTPAVAITLWP